MDNGIWRRRNTLGMSLKKKHETARCVTIKEYFEEFAVLNVYNELSGWNFKLLLMPWFTGTRM